MSKKTDKIGEDTERRNKAWQEFGGENMTQEGFEEILRRASLPLPSKRDQEKSQTSGQHHSDDCNGKHTH